MKLATLACLAALCLTGLDAHAAPGDPPAPQKTPTRSEQARPEAAKVKPDVGKVEPGKTEPSKTEPTKGEPAKAEPTRGEKAEPARPAAAGTGPRRRRSYAACNRASHQRGYYGGRRRRFLIRCRLGYERTRTPPAQIPAAAAPHPGRRP